MTSMLRPRGMRSLAAVALSICMLTLVPVASTSHTGTFSRDTGGSSVIHKNGDTPLWMAKAIERAAVGAKPASGSDRTRFARKPATTDTAPTAS